MSRPTGALATGLLLTVLLAALWAGAFAAPGARVDAQDASADACTGVVHSTALSPGFNLVPWLDASRPDADWGAIAAQRANPFTDAWAWAWDAVAQAYVAWHASLPPALNRLRQVTYGDAYWLLVPDGAASAFTTPVAADAPRTTPMHFGWNLATWTGPNNTDVWAAFSPQAFGMQTIVQSPFVGALAFDNATKAWRRFDPSLPDALNDLDTLDYGDPVWINLVAGLDWQIPAPGDDSPCGTDGTGGTDGPPAPSLALTYQFDTLPIDLALVTSVGPPGQPRGGDYKGHGYFRTADNLVVVVDDADALLVEGSRYIEGGEVQYLLFFDMPNGLRFLFDHIREPSDLVLDAFVGAPDPPVGDSRTYAIGPVAFVAGDLVGTAIGTLADGNAFVDFALYDAANPNPASLEPGFGGDPASWRDAYAYCWYDAFGAANAALIRSLLGGGATVSTASDFCEN